MTSWFRRLCDYLRTQRATRRGRPADRSARRLGFETLEPRYALSAAPVISNFTAVEGWNNTWELSGYVADEQPGGLIVNFGGVAAAYGRSATTDAQGQFSGSFLFDGIEAGTITATTVDNENLSSNVAWQPISPSHRSAQVDNLTADGSNLSLGYTVQNNTGGEQSLSVGLYAVTDGDSPATLLSSTSINDSSALENGSHVANVSIPTSLPADDYRLQTRIDQGNGIDLTDASGTQAALYSGLFVNGDSLIVHGSDAADTVSATKDESGVLTVSLDGNTFTYDPASGPVINTVFFYGHGGDDSATVSGLRAAMFGGDGNDILTAGNYIDSQTDSYGGNYLDGGADNDVLIGGLGDDVMCGVDGNDTLIIGDGGAASGNGGIDTFIAPDGSQLILSNSESMGTITCSVDGNNYLIVTKSGMGTVAVDASSTLSSPVVYKIETGSLTVPGPNGDVVTVSNSGSDSDVSFTLSVVNGNTLLTKDGTGVLSIDDTSNLAGDLDVEILNGSVVWNTPAVETLIASGVADTPGNWTATFNGAGELIYRGSNVYITHAENLVTLDCSYQNLDGTMDLSACSNLTTLNCSGNQLTELNVSGCSALTYLNCADNQIETLNIDGCTALAGLDLTGNQLPSLNLSGRTNLLYVNCWNNQLIAIDVSDCTALVSLQCGYNQLALLTVTGCTSLHELDCESNQLSALDLTGDSSLYWLNCQNNQIESLDVSGFSCLYVLECGSNQLSFLNVSGCANLFVLGCGANQISSLDLGGLSALYCLDCSNNQLVSLDVNEVPALNYLSCALNQLSSLDLSVLPSLQYFNGYGNQLTWLDLSGLSQLVYLSCDANLLTSLDVSSLTSLTGLTCSVNQLTSLDISALTQLVYLNCGYNQLTYLNFGNLNSLQSLLCEGNALDASTIDAAINACNAASQGGWLWLHDGANAAPSAAVAQQIAALIANGWYVSTN